MDVYRLGTSLVTRRDDRTQTVTINGVSNTITTIGATLPVPAQSQPLREERANAFVAGWTGGLGLEYMLWDCVFLRGEWEYIKFLSVKNTLLQANKLHFGIGYQL